MNYGTELKQHRELHALSQAQLAKETGLNQQAISLWETNKRTPSIENCVTLADYYGITLDELIGREPKKNWL